MVTEHIADSCVLWTGFDISVVARTYAQFTGILAGFAFVVINLMLDRAYRRRADGRSLEARESEHEVLVGIALVCAFLGLFLTTLRYGLLAGESGCAVIDGRASSAEVLAAVSFAASIYTLLYAIVQFFSGTAGVLAKHLVFILAIFVPPIAVFFVEDTLTHLALALGNPDTHQPLQPLWTWAIRLSLPLPLAILIICAIMWFLGMARRRSSMPVGTFARHLGFVVPYITVAVVAATVIRSVIALRYLDSDAHINAPEAWLWVGVLVIALLAQSAAVSFGTGVDVLSDGTVTSPENSAART
jgi:hypothetical protein